MQFVYQAMTSDGQTVSDRLEAASRSEAADALRAKGLTILNLDSRGAELRRAAAPLRLRMPQPLRWRAAGRGDLMLLARQLKMLLESGSAVVPALEAIEAQTRKPALRAVVGSVREGVERGGSLTEALREHPAVFSPVFCSMVAAGEATGALPDAFRRLAELTLRQQQVRRMLWGAMLYPAILSVLCLGVIGLLIGFVVPRFEMLFTNLRAKLPATTQMIFAVSHLVLHRWPYLLAGAAAAATGLYLLLRLTRIASRLDELLLRAPLLGRLTARLVLGRILRVWAAMLRCHVPLLETIQKSRDASRNAQFLELLGQVEESVASGGHVGRALAQSPLVEPVVAAAIATGEANGRLAESVEFVSNWLDDDNTQLIAGVTRIVEPAMLTLMGVIVGLVAMSLFLPLFDLATAGGH